MNVLVIGANGQVGKHLVKKIQETEGLTAHAMIRKEEQAPYFEELGAKVVMTDLEKATIDELAEAASGADTIVFTAGSGPKTGADKTMMIDLDAAIKTIEASKQAGIKRYIMVSSFDTTREAIHGAPESFAPYVVAKHYADVWLRATDLDYTIVHPGGLTNDAATGNVKIGTTTGRGDIPREDVASVLLGVIQNEYTIGKEFQVIGGNTPLESELKLSNLGG